MEQPLFTLAQTPPRQHPLFVNKNQARFLLVAALIWLLAMGVSITVNRVLGSNRWNAWPESPPMAIYSLALFLPVVLFLTWRPMFELISSWPRAHRILLHVFLSLIFIGHLANASRYTFPFMDWQMFTRSFDPDTIIHYEFVGLTQDGTEVKLNPVHEFPPLDNLRFYLGFRQFSEIIQQREEDEREPLWQVHDDVLIALARRHNQGHRDKLVTSIEVLRIEIAVTDLSKRSEAVTVVRQIAVP